MSYLKKTLAIFLLVCMLASMMPVGTAFAAGDVPGKEPAATESTPGGTSAGDTAGAPNGQSEGNASSTGKAATDPNSGDTTPCTHKWDSATGKCTKCQTVCPHDGGKNPVEGKAASCTEAGMTAGETCAICGAVTKAQTEVPALGHEWTTGRDESTCSGCGERCTHKEEGGATRFDPATGVCSMCKYSCDHTKAADGGTVTAFKDGVCEVCGSACTHTWTTGREQSTCSLCGAVCTHKDGSGATKFDAKTGACSVCGFQCGHKNADGKSTYALDAATGEYVCGLCKKTCTHSEWDTTNAKLAKCKECGKECDHKKDGNTNFDPATGKCLNGCPYTCLHGEVSNNQCTLCKMAMAAKITKSDSSVAYYADVNKAGSKAADGDTITLLANATLKSRVDIGCSNAVLDLNGKKLTGPTGLAIWVQKGSLTIKNGTIESGGYAGSGVIYVSGGSKITIEKDATISGKTDHGIFIAGEGTTAEIYGTLLSDDQAAITGNGTADYAGTIINVYDGAVLTSTNGTAIYHPQQRGVLNIKGGTMTGGETGVEVRAGTANISGGLIEGKGDPFTASPNGSGGTTVGAGLAVVQHSTKCAITVNVSGGTLKGVRAIYEANHSDSSPEELEKISINVTGGTLTGEVYSSDDKITFSGAAKDTPMTVPTEADASNPNAVVADTGFVHAGAKNEIDAGTKTDAVLPKKALAECATSSDTIVTVETDKATVSLDGAALETIDAAVADGGSATVHVEKLADAKEDTYKVYIVDQNGKKIASDGATLDGGKATVTFKNVTTEPKEVRHLKDDGTTLIEKLAYTYDATNQTVTVTLTNFSQIVLSAQQTPTIDEKSLEMPAVLTGDTVNKTLAASGDAPITWSYTGDLPQGLTLSQDGKLSGTVAEDAEAKDYTLTVKATNAAGFDEAQLTITVEEHVAAIVCDTDDQGNPIEGTDTTYPSVQEAIDAAADGQLVVVVEDSNDNVVVAGKEVYIIGDVEGRKLGSVTVKADDQGTPGLTGIANIKASTVTIEQGSRAGLTIGNDIGKVVNKNTIGNVNNPDPFVVIDDGHYGSLSPAKGGDYLVTGGTFGTNVPMEYCREVVTDKYGNPVVDKNGNTKIIQRCAKYDSARKAYVIAPFTFDITAVSNSGYHMPGSQKTLVFSTNLDYTLADRDRGDCTITVTSGNSSKPISSVYYEITADKNGKAQITLKASTLNRLALGRYTLTYDGPTGKDSMYFRISDTVKTGDTSNIGLWMGIMGVSVVALCAVAAVLVMKSKKKKDGTKKKDEK